MSNEEFENYVALIGKLLQLKPEQRDQIGGELQDHLQMRVADLTDDGLSKKAAIGQALEEFGDAAAMARNFQTVINVKRRRWMMRFATLSTAGLFVVTTLIMAMWPDNARFGAPEFSTAQETTTETKDETKAEFELSYATTSDLNTLEALKKPTTFDYAETPFQEVLEELQKESGLNIILHESAAVDELPESELITSHLKNVQLGKALEVILGENNATYIVDEGIVRIISLDEADDARWFRVRMYDCKELIKSLPKISESSQASKLVNIIQETINADSWQDTGQGLGTISELSGVLIVNQNHSTLRQIDRLLDDLKAHVASGNGTARHNKAFASTMSDAAANADAN